MQLVEKHVLNLGSEVFLKQKLILHIFGLIVKAGISFFFFSMNQGRIPRYLISS